MADTPERLVSDPPPITSSWDDLLDGVATREDWVAHRELLRQRFLELIRDDAKPERPPLDFTIHESHDVDGVYTRHLVSYGVEADERAHAWLAIPHGLTGPAPAVAVLHGTHPVGKDVVAGLVETTHSGTLDQVARRGYVAIAPDHFVAGHRTPPEGAYETGRFEAKHPDWTSVGKFTYEHSLALDVLQSLPEVDGERLGCFGHSLGGQGTIFLAAYDERIRACACNCSAPFFRHNREIFHWARDRWYVYLGHLRPGFLAGKLPPIDFHELIALIAPRAYLDLSGLNDGDPLTQRQRVLMLLKVADVYELVGAPREFAFYTHGRAHSIDAISRELIFAWLDDHLKG